MRRIVFASLALCLALGMGGRTIAAEDLPGASSPAAQSVKTALLIGLKAFDAAYRKDPNAATSRDLGYAALSALALEKDGDAAGRYLRTEVSGQKSDGSLNWIPATSSVVDPNATEFGTIGWGTILQRFGNNLSSDDRSRLRVAIIRALPAIESRPIAIGYTNMYLAQAIDSALLGAAVNDRVAEAYGKAHLALWMASLRKYGINEFDSPPYYAVDLGEISFAAAVTGDPEFRSQLRAILRYYARDIAAHMTSTRFGGAHSRDYDFPARFHGMARELALLGLQPAEPVWQLGVESIPALWGAAELATAGSGLGSASGPHVVETVYGTTGGAATYAYVTPNVELGSASSDYAYEDKLVDVSFGSETHAAIGVDPEGTGDPYGQTAGQKPGHLNVHLLPVQSLGTLLALYDLDPSEARSTASLATNILVPLAARVAINGTVVDTARNGSVKMTGGDVVTVSAGAATAAIRVALVEGIGGTSPTVRFVIDTAGKAVGVGRIVATSYEGAPTVLLGHVRVVLMFAVTDSGEDVAGRLRSATFQSDIGRAWTVEATIGSNKFVAVEDTAQRRAAAASVDGVPHRMPAPLQIDGQAVGL